MTLTKHLTDGGIPSGWTPQNLAWLAGQHWRFALGTQARRDQKRSDWHTRWAVLIEDLLESSRADSH